MVTWALILFAVAALVGLTMAIDHFRGNSPPAVAKAVVHGIFAASALVLVLVAAARTHLSGPLAWAAALFLLAALGGFTLAFGFHARKRPLPTPLLAGHALLAVASFLILLSFALGLV